jgi:branched-subunit amino acid transport protein
MTTIETVITILGLAVITLVTRAFFLIPDRDLPMPGWLREGLRYAPLAAMAAVVVPEIVTNQGTLIATWKDPRLYGAAAGAAYYFWRRGILGTIVCGTAVLLALKLLLGW